VSSALIVLPGADVHAAIAHLGNSEAVFVDGQGGRIALPVKPFRLGERTYQVACKSDESLWNVLDALVNCSAADRESVRVKEENS
jgi:hypothetical protein